MSYRVVVEPSGHQFDAEPGESILDAAIRQGYMLPYGCRNGQCGNCQGRLLTGRVEYGEQLPDALSETDRSQGLALFCQARAVSDVRIAVREIDNVREIPVRQMPCRVAAVDRLAHDVVRLKLTQPANQRLQFLAGQYIDFILQDGRRRAFSIANAPHDDEFIELHVRHVDGGEFTDFIFNQLKVKDILRIEGPLGSFFLREDSDRPLIFMAGGTGFAPVKGIIEHALAEGLARPMHLYWGARAQRDLYLDALPRSWAEAYPHFEYTPVLSDPLPEDGWEGRTGFVHEAVVADHADLSGHDIYASGPPVMVEAGFDAFADRGLPAEQYYSDAFEYARDKVSHVAG